MVIRRLDSLSCAWQLAIRSLVDGSREPTAGYVKLLLPPRQSRGNSHFGLDRFWHETPLAIGQSNVRSARILQTSTCSAMASASSTSIPRYRTVLSIF